MRFTTAKEKSPPYITTVKQPFACDNNNKYKYVAYLDWKRFFQDSKGKKKLSDVNRYVSGRFE